MPNCSAVFVGNGSLLTQCADAFRQAGHTVRALVSANPALLRWAAELGIPAFDLPRGARISLPVTIEFDYLFSVANLEMLPAELITRARQLAINFHDALLPAYAGLNATSWALMAQERRHGVTWHEMLSTVDAGRVIRQTTFEVQEGETALSLNARCYEAGLETFCLLVKDLEKGAPSLAAQAGQRTYFGRHQRPDAFGLLDFRRPACDLAALACGLDFGLYANPLGLTKLYLGERIVFVRSARDSGQPSRLPPGTVVSVQGVSLQVASASQDIILDLYAEANGADAHAAMAALTAGDVLPVLPALVHQKLSQQQLQIAQAEPAWASALLECGPLDLPYPRLTRSDAAPDRHRATFFRASLGQAVAGARTVGAFAAWLSALTGQAAVAIRYCDTVLQDQACGLEPWVSAWVPLVFHHAKHSAVAESTAAAQALMIRAHMLGPMSRDLAFRQGDPHAVRQRIARIGICLGAAQTPENMDIVLGLDASGQTLELRVDEAVYTQKTSLLMAEHLSHFLACFAQSAGETSVGSLPLAPPSELLALAGLNNTKLPFESGLCVHEAIARQAELTPEQLAISCQGQSLSYRELMTQAGQASQQLLARGARPGAVVGLCLDRSPALVVAMLAILKTGAAYLPLDPAYPRERLAFMIQDSAAALVVCRPDFARLMSIAASKAVDLESQEPLTSKPSAATDQPPWPAIASSSPAYVIYTSGSTGQPKGVVVTHRNVLNFFAGMSSRVPHAAGDRWLAVTSLSFDISVLELAWTLSRGLTVVLHTRQARARQVPSGPEFSLFYFASADSAGAAERYKLLMEGARFADQNGFLAIWTPERHFHAFGGLYPNPALTSAAIASITTRLKLRAGSCVLPLHHPVRVAEDWAFVDNLSNGRVGVSFASGWQPNDFVLAPDKFADRKAGLLADLDVVRRLWRGERLEFPGPQGKPVAVQTLPRPVQPELPVWLTAAGNPETFEQAGDMGCHLLTHLLGQTVAEVEKKIALYRAAWKKAGHAGTGQVTLMLHTFIGDDEEAVRETVRAPMKNYLRSSMDLIRQAAWSFPTFVQRAAADGRNPIEIMDAEPLSSEDMDALLEHAFSRYYGTSALFGTAQRCAALVGQIKAAGVDEIACLIDFGVDARVVLDHLPGIRQLMEASRSLDAPVQPASVAGDILDEAVTHLQCTPSMASMLVADQAGRAALSQLSALLVGGEALPPELARELRALVPGALMNMYGPTETTVWSTTCELAHIGEYVPLGQAIANTTLSVRSAWDVECPALVSGELLIGGEGVTEGYLHRPELTAERFIIDDAFPDQRLYRTGDLVRRHPDGALEYLGRMDKQVKIRGHRIELGEIENALMRHPGVKEAAVLAREGNGGDKFLSAYVTLRPGVQLSAAQVEVLRSALASSLPEPMLPKTVQVLAAFPLTPNGKTDRKMLAQTRLVNLPVQTASAFESTLEKDIAAIWEQVLGIPQAGLSDNFFDLGGHSLLVIQVQRRLRESTGLEISITDMFRLPTIRALAAHLAGQAPATTAVTDGLNRANARRVMRTRSSLQKT